MITVPKGKSPYATKTREQILLKELQKYEGRIFSNKCLSKDIKFLIISTKEIAHHAAKGYKSTLAALQIPKIIRNSNVLYIDLPKSGKQSKTFYASLTIILHCQIEGIGRVKLTICDGLKFNDKNTEDLIVYCVSV